MIKGNLLYKIYYRGPNGSNSDGLVYIGRTRQALNTRLRGHFFKKPMHRMIDIFQVSKIEYAAFNTVADMYLYEIYFINKEKPPLNRDDKADDILTVELPPVKWKQHDCHLMEKWKAEIVDGETAMPCKCGNMDIHVSMSERGGFYILCPVCGNRTAKNRYREDTVREWNNQQEVTQCQNKGKESIT